MKLFKLQAKRNESTFQVTLLIFKLHYLYSILKEKLSGLETAISSLYVTKFSILNHPNVFGKI